MGRPIRIEYPGALYHITSRGNEKKKIFLKDADRIKFLKILEDYHDRYGILIHGYILMDNHYHLILETPKGNLLKEKGDVPFKGLYNQVILGGEEFIGKIKGMLKGRRLPQGIVGRKRLVDSPSPMEVVGVVSEVFGVNREEILDRGSYRHLARKVAIYLCQRYTGLSYEAIGKLFGGIHYSTVSKVTERIREEMLRDKKLSELMNRVTSHFKA